MPIILKEVYPTLYLKESKSIKKKGKLRLGAKILLIFLSVIIIFSAIVGYMVNREMTENIKHMATEKTKGDVKLGYAYLLKTQQLKQHEQASMGKDLRLSQTK